MSVSKNKYGIMPDGREVYEYILTNGNLTAHIINYGGIITKLITKDKNNNDVDVVLGWANLEEYIKGAGNLGAAIGRFANRISGASFELNEKTYTLAMNSDNNSIHGGVEGFDKKLWNVSVNDNETSITMEYSSADGEEGYPGKLDVKMKYSVTDENGLKIEYFATSDKDTLCNLTNHSYFNLNGYNGGKIYDHKMQISSGFYTPNSSECVPTGEVLSSKGTPFDFTTPKKLGEGINSDFEQIKQFGGYDHNIILDGTGVRKALTVTGDKTDITMEMITNQPGVQLYTANALESANKGDCENSKHDGFCLETQAFPDCVHFGHFPSAVLKAGDEYYHITEYRFV